MRLDKYLAERFPQYSRTKIKMFIESAFVLVNGKPSKPGFLVSENDHVRFKESLIKKSEFIAEDFNFTIVYEDDSCLVVDKPPFVVVHPGDGGMHVTGTLANALVGKLGGAFPGDTRPGIVHRLDKDTSGLIVIAKTPAALSDLLKQFKLREVQKVYLALVLGRLPKINGIIEAAIGRDTRNRKRMAVVSGAKDAVSHYKVKGLYELEGSQYLSLVEVEIKTGRTHQIRVHFSAIDHPVVGDATYGSRKMNTILKRDFLLDRQFLHAFKLSFKSPATGELVVLESDLPKDLQGVLEKLRVFKVN